MPKKSSFGDLSLSEQKALAARIRAMVEAAGSQKAAAEIAQVSVRQIAAYTAGESAPPFLPIARLAERTGFRLEWVMSGRGPQRHNEPPSLTGRRPVELDAELLGRLVDAISRIYRDERVALPETDLGRIAAVEYADIVAATDDPVERLAMVKLVGEKHRRMLRTENPSSRKLGA